MNLLSRARLSGRIRLYYTSSLQQCNSYSTSRTPKSPNPKSPKSPNPKSPKSPVPPSSFSDKMKRPTGETIVWPKPSEIPYQAKVARYVNLIGYVKAPVQFDSAPDGFFAGTTIAQEGGNDSFFIPVVFEGDLAHVVATHVKENDCVLVSGQLSSEQSRFTLKEALGDFHVVCDNLNFVEGFKSGFPWKKLEGSVSAVGAKDGGIRNVVEGVTDDKFDHNWEKASEEAEVKKLSGESNVGSKGARLGTGEPTIESGDGGDKKKDGVKKLSGEANWESNVGSKGAMWATGEPTLESGDSGDKKKDGAESGAKKNDGDQWRDLVKNSLNWCDFRDQKAKGLKGEKYPDFMHKQTDYALWFDSAPTWVLPGFEKLEFDVPVARANQESGAKTKDEDQWRDLLKNSLNWWDFRDQKAKGLVREKFPDFKHKQTDYALWFNSAPTWVLPGFEKLEFDVPVARANQESGAKKKDEDQWRDLLKNSLNWWDFRDQKAKGLVREKFPDFKHKQTDYALWFNSAPTWVLPGFEKLEFDVPVARANQESGAKKKDEDQWRDLLKNSLNWWDFRDQKVKGLVREKFPDFKHKQTDYALWFNSAPTWVLPGFEKLEFDVPVARANPVQRSQGSGEKKSNVEDEESWKDLVENPSQWWDNRTNKRHPKGPDFKHKQTGVVLCFKSAPTWVLPRFEKLEFDAPVARANQESGAKKKDDGDQWRDLVLNSPNWWDFRDQKAKGLKEEQFPDFMHKQTGDALWFKSAPAWVLPGFDKWEFDVPVARANPVQRNQGSGEKKSNVEDEESWKDLVENPSQWWDNRTNKRNPKGPDFKHKQTGKGLWLNDSPDWALSKLPPLN